MRSTLNRDKSRLSISTCTLVDGENIFSRADGEDGKPIFYTDEGEYGINCPSVDGEVEVPVPFFGVEGGVPGPLLMEMVEKMFHWLIERMGYLFHWLIERMELTFSLVHLN
jgi:hypothetical protein